MTRRALPVVDYELRWMIDHWAEGTVARYAPLFMMRKTHDGDLPARGRFVDSQALVLGDRGRAVHVVNSVPHAMSAGDVCLMGAGSDQTLARADGLLLCEIFFRADIFDRLTWTALRATPGVDALLVGRRSARRFHLHAEAHLDLSDDLLELWGQWQIGTRNSAVIVRALFLRLLVRLAGFAVEGRAASKARGHEELIFAIVREIDRHHGVGLRVERIAAKAHLSRRRFTDVFTSVVGEPPSTYIRNARLERAKMLLTTTTMPLADVARSTGFVDHSHFTRTFRGAVGTTPSAFRRVAV